MMRKDIYKIEDKINGFQVNNSNNLKWAHSSNN